MYQVVLTLDKFFLKYEGGNMKLTLPPVETSLKKPGIIRVNVECVLLGRNFNFSGGYCSLHSGYCSLLLVTWFLLVVTACYRSLLLVPTFSMNGFWAKNYSLVNWTGEKTEVLVSCIFSFNQGILLVQVWTSYNKQEIPGRGISHTPNSL